MWTEYSRKIFLLVSTLLSSNCDILGLLFKSFLNILDFLWCIIPPIADGDKRRIWNIRENGVSCITTTSSNYDIIIGLFLFKNLFIETERPPLLQTNTTITYGAMMFLKCGIFVRVISQCIKILNVFTNYDIVGL